MAASFRGIPMWIPIKAATQAESNRDPHLFYQLFFRGKAQPSWEDKAYLALIFLVPWTLLRSRIKLILPYRGRGLRVSPSLLGKEEEEARATRVLVVLHHATTRAEQNAKRCRTGGRHCHLHQLNQQTSWGSAS